MPRDLKISIGQHSDKGRKEINQDFHGVLIPEQPLLGLKGIAIALADGISSSEVSRIASESAIKLFLTDYYCTSQSWSVKTSAQRVLDATNSWLHAQTRRGPNPHDRDKGYVCTMDVMVVKSRAAHLFHIGDARISRLVGTALEQLTDDHRVRMSSAETYLGRALGMSPRTEIDYRAIPIEPGDIFVLTTDGVHEHVSGGSIAQAIETHAHDLDQAARAVIREAFEQGSPDNLTIQIVRIDAVADGEAADILAQAGTLQPPPLLEPGMVVDEFTIVRQIHASSRSHIYLATQQPGGRLVAVKIPSIDLRDDADYLRRFMMEEWVAQRINSAHVLKPAFSSRNRSYLYGVMEFIEGQTLTQWMTDHPAPELETVRGIVEQIAAGLRAFHRMEMVHQDLRPDNIMIDATGTVRIIDFGSTKIAGVIEALPAAAADGVLGTAQYTAPEYFLGDAGSVRSDIFSLGTITYQMLTGHLPYGAAMAQAPTRARQRKVAYRPARNESRDIPTWMDAALRRAVHHDPARRYEELSEYLYDLRHPNPEFSQSGAMPLIERNPLLFWKVLSGVLACVIAWLLTQQIWR